MEKLRSVAQMGVTRRDAFLTAFWAGLAAPAMLFSASPSYLLYDANAGLQQAWADVGRRMSEALPAQDDRRQQS